MELFAFAGLSNASILLTAAAVLGVAAVISVVTRNLGFSPQSALASRVDRLEIRTATNSDHRTVISMAGDILTGVEKHAVPHVVEMFEDARVGASWMGSTVNTGEAAYALINELKAGIEIAAAIARPLQNMTDNGSIEIRAERIRLASDIRKQVSAIRTQGWDRHGTTILSAGIPSNTVSTVVNCFGHLRALKSSALALTRNSSVGAFAGLLTQSAAVLASANHGVELFQGRNPQSAVDLDAAPEGDAAPDDTAGREATHVDSAGQTPVDEHHAETESHAHAA